MIPFERHVPLFHRHPVIRRSNISMVARHQTRRGGTGIAQSHRRAGIALRDTIVYYLRSILFPQVLLGVFSRQTVSKY